MVIKVYNPVEGIEFSSSKCFLTGQEISEEEQSYVFPEWLMDRYTLRNNSFTMLGDGNRKLYQDLKVPCSRTVVNEKVNLLEAEIQKAFCVGYEEVVKLPKEKIFQWMAKLMYGILYNDLVVAKREQEKRGEVFALSPFLEQRFKYLHLMLQSIVLSMEYKGFTPWSIEVVRVKYSKDIFNYKDETNNLNFSLGMNGFGIVACLQDNGKNSIYHQELVSKIGDTVLHPVQFEELCGRFIYSNYILKQYPAYIINADNDKVVLEPKVSNQEELTKGFGVWEDEMYGQVLANYWKPWGIAMKDIHVFPNPPISFLVSDYSEKLIPLESISLPF